MQDVRTPRRYRRTVLACFGGSISQAAVNAFPPLLFVTFSLTYCIPLAQMTLLIVCNFCVQLLTDYLVGRVADRVGYRRCLVAAGLLSAGGLAGLCVLPGLLPHPFAGLLLSTMIYAVGSAIIEVLVSPLIEACPMGHKAAAMSLLHSAYCWSCAAVVLFAVGFFACFGTVHWRAAALLLALLPLADALLFLRAPIPSLPPRPQGGYFSFRELLHNRLFLLLAAVMILSGACEQAASQWASALAEQGLGVEKALGDLCGPLCFSLTMGSARALYAVLGPRLSLRRVMCGSGVLCLLSYLCIGLAPWPVLSFVGCALCGFSVGIFWPGTLSLSAARIPGGGTAMFSVLALCGDLGCAAGPSLVGLICALPGGGLQPGMLTAAAFPALMLAALAFLPRGSKGNTSS